MVFMTNFEHSVSAIGVCVKFEINLTLAVPRPRTLVLTLDEAKNCTFIHF